MIHDVKPRWCNCKWQKWVKMKEKQESQWEPSSQRRNCEWPQILSMGFLGGIFHYFQWSFLFAFWSQVYIHTFVYTNKHLSYFSLLTVKILRKIPVNYWVKKKYQPLRRLHTLLNILPCIFVLFSGLIYLFVPNKSGRSGHELFQWRAHQLVFHCQWMANL